MISFKLYAELVKHIGIYKASSDIFIHNNKILIITRPTGCFADNDNVLEQLTLIDITTKKVLEVVTTTSDTDIKRCVLKIVNKFLR